MRRLGLWSRMYLSRLICGLVEVLERERTIFARSAWFDQHLGDTWWSFGVECMVKVCCQKGDAT
jgi:hypothetical protein